MWDSVSGLIVMGLSGILRCASLILHTHQFRDPTTTKLSACAPALARTPFPLTIAHMTRDKRDRKAKHVTTNIGSRVLLHAHLHLAKTDPASRPFDVTRASSYHKTPTKMTDFVIHFHHSSSQSMSNSSYLSFSIFDPAEYSTSCRTMHAATGDHSFTAAWGKQNLQKTPV